MNGLPALVLCEIECGCIVSISIVKGDFVLAHIDFGVILFVFKDEFTAEVVPSFDVLVFPLHVETVEAVEVFHLQRA